MDHHLNATESAVPARTPLQHDAPPDSRISLQPRDDGVPNKEGGADSFERSDSRIGPAAGGSSSGRSLPRRNGGAGRISTHDINLGIPTNAAALEHAEETHGAGHWRAGCLHFLHRRWIQRTLLGLLVADIVILFTETFLLAAYPHCNIVLRDCISCCPADGQPDDGGGHDAARWLSGGGEEEVCDTGYDPSGEPACDGEKWHGVHTIEEVLFYCTVTILFIFFVENVVEIVALGPGIFFRQLWFVFDFSIVTVSLSLELAFHFQNDDYLYTVVGFLIFFRLWRFIRIGHGLIEATAELTHEQYEGLIEYARHCEEQLLARGIEPPTTTDKVKKMLIEIEH